MHMDSTESASAVSISRGAHPSSRMPQSALIFRWLVGVVGIVGLAALTPQLHREHLAELAILLAISVGAELWLTVESPRRRFISLYATFVFIVFLSFGALAAALIAVLALALAHIVRILDKSH